MSVQRGNGQNGGHFYSNITQPVKIDFNFIVDSANGNGLGLRSLKSNGYVESVFMNSSASITGTTHTTNSVTSIAQGTSSLKVGMPVQASDIPVGTTIASIVDGSSITLSAAATGSNASETITYQGVGSPNPAAGLFQIQFKNNYRYYLGGFNGFASPVSGTPILVTTGVTAGLAYIIVSVGSTSLAQWQKLGLPAGETPAVGVSFIAPVTTTATGSGVIEVPKASGILTTEIYGDSHLMTTSSLAQYSGQRLIGAFLAPTLSSTTIHNNPMIPTAPIDGSVAGFSCFFDISSVTIDGL